MRSYTQPATEAAVAPANWTEQVASGKHGPMPTKQMPVFFINLAARRDRRQFMEDQFARLGIVAERIEAVTIADVPQPLIDAQLRPGRPWRITAGDLACGLSHQLIWQTILRRNLDCALVLEDDALLAPTVVDFLDPGILDRTGADIIRLETWASSARLGTREIRIGTTVVRELASAQFGSAAYIMSGKAAAASLSSPKRDDMAVDRFLFRRGGVHLLRSCVLQAVPGAAVQLLRSGLVSDASRSEITPERPSIHTPADPSLRRRLQLRLDHACRVARLVLRDPAIVRGPKTAIPFAGAVDSARDTTGTSPA